MRSLDRPCAASNTILARTTTRYGDVYFLARASNSRRSSGDSSIGYGLLLDIPPPPPRWKDNESQGKMDPYYTSLYFLKIGLSPRRPPIRVERLRIWRQADRAHSFDGRYRQPGSGRIGRREANIYWGGRAIPGGAAIVYSTTSTPVAVSFAAHKSVSWSKISTRPRSRRYASSRRTSITVKGSLTSCSVRQMILSLHANGRPASRTRRMRQRASSRCFCCRSILIQPIPPRL